MSLDQIIAYVRGTDEFTNLLASQKALIAAGNRDVIAQCLQQRISILNSVDASKANSVRAVLMALNQLCPQATE